MRDVSSFRPAHSKGNSLFPYRDLHKRYLFFSVPKKSPNHHQKVIKKPQPTSQKKKKKPTTHTPKIALEGSLKDRFCLFSPDHHFGQTFPRLWRAAFSLLLKELHQQCLESCNEEALTARCLFLPKSAQYTNTGISW